MQNKLINNHVTPYNESIIDVQTNNNRQSKAKQNVTHLKEEMVKNYFQRKNKQSIDKKIGPSARLLF